MRKRNVDIVATVIDDETVSAPCVKLACDGCWLYAYDIQSIYYFQRIVRVLSPTYVNSLDFETEYKLRFTIPVTGKAIVTEYIQNTIEESDSLVRVFNDAIEYFECQKYDLLPDMLKFVHFFLPAYIEKQIVYFVTP